MGLDTRARPATAFSESMTQTAEGAEHAELGILGVLCGLCGFRRYTESEFALKPDATDTRAWTPLNTQQPTMPDDRFELRWRPASAGRLDAFFNLLQQRH